MLRLAPLALLAALAACSQAPSGPPVAFATLKGDAGAGRATFGTCAACHSVEPDANGSLGPSLHGVIGRKAGSVPGYDYSAAMRAHGQGWTPAHVYAFLEAPQRVVPGTKMGWGGTYDPQRRADLVAYLETLR